jgi:ABC-type Fe3+/spermidine/putrescine transport system ATPase subunit/nucleotide-binding universal stress UspA family protein
MSIVLEHLTKRFAGHPVVNGVSLTAGDGELYVLLGPSGSGKSTLLRIIAGLADADAGRVVLHDRDVTDLPPPKRGVGFVFQSYALFRGMTAAENVEFALRIRGVKADERRRRRDELLEMVGLTGLGGRTPRQLSGGQQQRVALARALAHQPEVLLLDEPFGALDARVRLELRRTVRAIQRELGITTLFVTHDQDEAFELADRVAVMNFGRLLEEGPPDELYLRPATEFVATFLGTANLMVGECSAAGVSLGPVRFPLSTQGEAPVEARRVQVLFRPEDVALRDTEGALACPALGRAIVDQRAFVGSYERLRLRLPPLPGVRPIAPAVPFGSDEIVIEATRSPDEARRYPLQAADSTWVGVRRVHALVHPGLRLLLLADGTPASQAAVGMGGQLARLAHARVTVLGYHPAAAGAGRAAGSAPPGAPGAGAERRLPGAAKSEPEGAAAALEAAGTPGAVTAAGAAAAQGAAAPAGAVAPPGRLAPPVRSPRRYQVHDVDERLELLLQQVRETLGSGLAALETRTPAGPPEVAVAAEEEARQPADLVVAGLAGRDSSDLAERLLGAGGHHLLLVPEQAGASLERLLICVAIGEPGKADVSFSGRLARHLGAQVTILTVLPESERGRSAAGAERFLASSARTLARQGVAVTTRVRHGLAREQILLERAEGHHDLLVVGAPLPGAGGRIALDGLLSRLLREAQVPVLIVRSPEAGA